MQAHPFPLVQALSAEIQLSPHAFPLRQTLQQDPLAQAGDAAPTRVSDDSVKAAISVLIQIAPPATRDRGCSIHAAPLKCKPMSLFLFFAAAIVPAGETFTCTPTRVWDGDGPVWCAEGPRIRLAGIAAREIDGSCRDNQPCPRTRAEDARDALVQLVGRPVGRSLEGHILVSGPPMQCLSEGDGKGSRTAAWCVSPIGGDVSCAMVRGGWALRWDRYWREHKCT